MSRPTFDEMMMELCSVVAKRSTCSRRAVGAVAARDNRILAMGYNGAPAGERHCDHTEVNGVQGDTENGHCAVAIHAEPNLICNAAREGISLKGATLYLPTTPCKNCLGLLINVGISRIVCADISYAVLHKDSPNGWVNTQTRCREAGISIELLGLGKPCTCQGWFDMEGNRIHQPDNENCMRNQA